MYDDPTKHPSTYVRFGGYIPKTQQNIPTLKIGSNIYDIDQNKEFYQQSRNLNYYNNNNYESNSIITSLNFKDRNISSNKIEFNTPSLDDLIVRRHKQRNQTNNLTFLNNIKMNQQSTIMKDSYTSKYSDVDVRNEIPILFRAKRRNPKLFIDNTEYNQNINVLNPIKDKRLVIADDDGLKVISNHEKDELIKKSLEVNAHQLEDSKKDINEKLNSHNQYKKNFLPALRYEYDNTKINDGTCKSVNISSLSTVHVPKDKLNNENNEYLKNSISTNSRSKQKDFFIKNNKILQGENIHIRIPGFSGHVPSNVSYLKQKERISCLSIDKS